MNKDENIAKKNVIEENEINEKILYQFFSYWLYK